ncbi:MAG: Asp23/Gls24 family envelope stress response protein, partial [Anaerolineaceae bacterium]
IAPDVLVDITRLAALGVEGVARLAPVPGGVNRLFRRGTSEGVQILVDANKVEADIYVILQPNTNILEVSREVQNRVARAIEEMVGMEVSGVHIHVEDIAVNSFYS